MPVWKNFADGQWFFNSAGVTNWQGNAAPPDAIDAIATFNDLPGAGGVASVNLAGLSATVGTVNMTSSPTENYNIRNGDLFMQVSSGSARINVDVSGAGPAYAASAFQSGLTLHLSSDTIVATTGASTEMDIRAKITGTGRLTKNLLGTLKLENGLNDWTGGTTINNGTLLATGANVMGSGEVVINANGVLDLGGFDQSIGTLSGSGVIRSTGGGATLTHTNPLSTTFSGILANGANPADILSLTKAGAGDLELTGANTFTGATTINAGTLNFAALNALGSGDVFITNTGKLISTITTSLTNSRLHATVGSNATIAASVGQTLSLNAGTFTAGGGAGTVLHIGGPTLTGTVILAPTIAASWDSAGALSIDGGTFKLGNSHAISLMANLQGGTTIAIGATLEILDNTAVYNLSGGGTIAKSASGSLSLISTLDTIFTGVIQDGVGGAMTLSKTGSGRLTLFGDSTYTGATSIIGGALVIGDGFLRGSIGTGNITNNAALIYSRSNSVVVANVISGTGTLTHSGTGTLILTGANTYSGTTTVSFVGALQIGNGGTTGALGTGVVSLSGSLNAGLVFNRSDLITVANAISGVGWLTQSGAGTLTLTGANSYTGNTTINAGTLALSGTGTIASSSSLFVGVGGTGTLDISGISGSTAFVKSLDSASGFTAVLGGKTLNVTEQDGIAVTGNFIGSAGTDALVVTKSGHNLNLSSATFTNWTDGIDLITINGNANANTITGSSRADTINVGEGADTINGGDGEDTLIGGAVGAGAFNQLNGDAGNDTASYVGTSGNVFADILNSNAGTINGVLIDVYTSIENLIGGDGSDTLQGNNNVNRLSGGAGDDLLFGQDGNDTMIGGAHVVGSFNQLFGGNGADTVDYSTETGKVFVDLRAPAGHIDTGGGFILNDLMNSVENAFGGSNDDILVGTDADNNLLVGNNGTDLLFGFNGNDTLIGGSAQAGQYNQLFGDAGSDTASYLGTTRGVYADLNVLAGWVKNGAGELILTDVYSQLENLTGGSTADTLVGDTGGNILNGGAGADILYANFDANAPSVHDAAVDMFAYANGSESTLGSGFDQIVNFTSSQDKLDFRALNINAGNVTLNDNLNGTWSVYADTDGVAGIGNNDLAILVQNASFVMSDIIFV